MLGDLPQRRDELGELARSFQTDGARDPDARAEPGGVESKPGTHRRAAHGRIDRPRGRTGETDPAVAGKRRFGVEPVGAEHESSRESDRGSGGAAGSGGCDRVSRSAHGRVVRRGQGRSPPPSGRARLSGQCRSPANRFPIGSGIVGQAAQSRRPIVTEPDAEKLRVQFGFGAVSPSQIAAYPLLANDAPVGVLEFCLFKPLTGDPNPLVGESVRDGGQRAALRAGKRGATAGRGAHPAHPRIQRRGHLRHGHRGTDHLREPRRLPDARVHRRGTDRAAFSRRLPSPPSRRQRVSEGRMPDVRRLQARQGQPH